MKTLLKTLTLLTTGLIVGVAVKRVRDNRFIKAAYKPSAGTKITIGKDGITSEAADIKLDGQTKLK